MNYSRQTYEILMKKFDPDNKNEKINEENSEINEPKISFRIGEGEGNKMLSEGELDINDDEDRDESIPNELENVIETEEDIFQEPFREISRIPDNKEKYFKCIIPDSVEAYQKNEHGIVSFLIYRTNDKGLAPFLEFCLYRYSDDDINLITFPQVFVQNESLSNVIDNYLNKNNLVSDINPSYKIIGKIIVDNLPVIVINLEDINIFSYQDSIEYSYVWSTTYEIINTRSIYGVPIHDKLTNCFINNSFLITLYDFNDNPIEVPEILYVGDKSEKILYESVVGLTKSSPLASLGPFYYLSTYENALRYSKDNNLLYGLDTKKKKKDSYQSGILRCAVFTGRMKIMMNRSIDIEKDEIGEDLSLMVTEQQNYDYLEKTKFMRDNVGYWARKYDSIYAGRVQLEDDTIYKKEPIFVVKYWSQQLALSWRLF
tara:strand:+ start:2305 stop:3591 length:1287 start_codon:yes stop_codon:yes gene_type:complete